MALTKGDFKRFEELMELTFDRKFEERLGLELEQTLDDKLKYLPTKEEFYIQEDKVLKELKNIREEMQILNGLHEKVNNHETRIEKLEEKLLA